jgi:hypothetical protein
MGVVTAFALAFVDGEDGRASGFWAAQPSCSLLCVLTMLTCPQRDIGHDVCTRWPSTIMTIGKNIHLVTGGDLCRLTLSEGNQFRHTYPVEQPSTDFRTFGALQVSRSLSLAQPSADLVIPAQAFDKSLTHYISSVLDSTSIRPQ